MNMSMNYYQPAQHPHHQRSKKFRIAAVAAACMVLAGAFAFSRMQSRGRSFNEVEMANAAAVDYFLKIEGIEGESADDKHKGEIDVESWSWGINQGGRQAAGGGGGAGKVGVDDFSFTKKVDKSSPELMLGVAAGKHFKEAKLMARKAGKDQQEYLVVMMTDVLISSYQVGGDKSSLPADQISLNFAKIEYEYKPQNPDGSLGAPVTSSFDFAKNVKQ